MTGTEIIEFFANLPPTIKDIGAIAIIFSFIEVSPLKLNPWKWLKAFYDLPKRLETLENEFNNDRAFRWRSQILRRADYALNKKNKIFSRETWEDTIDTIRNYEEYCKNHKDYQNGKAEFAIDYLRKRYQDAIDKNDFLDASQEYNG